MKSSALYTVDKKVNKSLQDRLRRDRISRSVEQLRELLLGPSIEHAKIGKADILKLTVQYVRNLRQKELRENTSEDHKSLETYNRQHVLKTSRDSFVDKPSTCPSHVRLSTAKKFKPEIDAVSENPKASCDENINSHRELFPIQSRCTAQSVVFQNAPGVSPSRNGVQRRTPFRELNGNSKQEKDKQIIWRPW